MQILVCTKLFFRSALLVKASRLNMRRYFSILFIYYLSLIMKLKYENNILSFIVLIKNKSKSKTLDFNEC